MYGYLGRARRDLWAALQVLPDDVLSRPVLDGPRFQCIKDMLFHVPAVEDGWIHEDILRAPPVLETTPILKDTTGGPVYAAVSRDVLLSYWRAVEKETLAYLATVDDHDLARVVTVHDAPDERYSVDGLLWHVLLHEVRHTAQMA